MTLEAVVRREFDDAIRSRWLHGAALFFALFIGGASLVMFGLLLPPEMRSASNLFGFFLDLGVFSLSFPGLLALVLGFVALSTSYGAITEERETGTVKLALSLPNSRADLLGGKLLGLGAVVSVALLVGFLSSFVVLLGTGTAIDYGAFVPHVALTVLLALAFVSIGVGISALADSNRGATLATLGTFLVFGVLWSSFAEGIPQLLDRVLAELPGLTALDDLTRVQLGLFLKYLNPLRTYETLAAQLYSGPVDARLVSASFGEQVAMGPVLQESIPFYFSWWFLLLVLLSWIAVPALVGYRVFERRDL